MSKSEAMLYTFVFGKKFRPVVTGDLAEEFCKIPEHEAMSEAFIASRGRYGRKDFLRDFNCPGWAYDFLVSQIRSKKLANNS